MSGKNWFLPLRKCLETDLISYLWGVASTDSCHLNMAGKYTNNHHHNHNHNQNHNQNPNHNHNHNCNHNHNQFSMRLEVGMTPNVFESGKNQFLPFSSGKNWFLPLDNGKNWFLPLQNGKNWFLPHICNQMARTVARTRFLPLFNGKIGKNCGKNQVQTIYGYMKSE